MYIHPVSLDLTHRLPPPAARYCTYNSRQDEAGSTVPALPKETDNLSPQAMGSFHPAAMVHFCVRALAHFVPEPGEGGRDTTER